MTYKVVDRRGQRDPMAVGAPAAVMSPPVKKIKTLNQMINECSINPTPGRYIFLGDEFDYKGRMHIPDTAKRRGTTGIIIKANPLPEEGDLYQVGQRVLIGRYSGTLIEFENKPAWTIIQATEILGWVTTNEQLSDQTVG